MAHYDYLLSLRAEIAKSKAHIRTTNSTISDMTIAFIFEAAKDEFKRVVRSSFRAKAINEREKQMLLLNL